MYQLYIGNKNYSSWSLRGFLAMKLSGAPFAERMVSLSGTGEPNPGNRSFSPTGRVPCLHDGATVVWDSLAIAEYLAERHPGMWPTDPATRAWARSVAAEMHSGFSALRNEMTMCIRERVDVRPWSDGLVRDIARVTDIWNEGRGRYAQGGPYLCGAYSLADVFYAPGAHTLTKEKVGTRYDCLAIRTFVNPNDAADVRAVHALQDMFQPFSPLSGETVLSGEFFTTMTSPTRELS